MADPRFHRRGEPLRLASLAERTGAKLSAGADPDRLITDVAPLQQAGPTELSFFDNVRYVAAFEASKAQARSWARSIVSNSSSMRSSSSGSGEA